MISYDNGFKEISLSARIRTLSRGRVRLLPTVFTCLSAPMIASVSAPAIASSSCNECPSQFFFFFFFSADMGSGTTGENNQLVLHGGGPHDNMKRGLKKLLLGTDVK